MATRLIDTPLTEKDDDGFFMGSAILMAMVIVAGFSMSIVMGRSSFGAAPVVHAHALVFMSWVGIYGLQNYFATRGPLAWHRRLGWLSILWLVAMPVVGIMVTLAKVRAGNVPFFFRPLEFLVFDPLSILLFLGLTIAAIAMRRQTDWHRRLHFCAMTLLLGPGIGRLLPLPLLIPWAFMAVFMVSMLFPIAGMIADRRRSGRVHPAWGWGVAVLIASPVLTTVIMNSAVGDALYRSVTAETPGAAIAPLVFPQPPG